MKRAVCAFAIVSLATLGGATCKPKAKGASDAGPDAASSAAAAGPVDAGPPPSFDVAAMTNKVMSFDMHLPKGYKTVSEDAASSSYSYPLDATRTLAVTVSHVAGVTSVDSAVADATSEDPSPDGGAADAGPSNIADKSEVDTGNFLVVKREDPATLAQDVYFYRSGKSVMLRAKCSGPSIIKDRLIDVCKSLTLHGTAKPPADTPCPAGQYRAYPGTPCLAHAPAHCPGGESVCSCPNVHHTYCHVLCSIPKLCAGEKNPDYPCGKKKKK